ncbi:MAG: Cna B-type domain-containing protein [Clostridiales bacterium]|nr:Cna B-type domain-containing protein [Clostridiales bacterium]
MNFGKQLKTDINGVEYEYYVKEVTVLENYTKVEEGLKVTNTYKQPDTEEDVIGEKVWVNSPKPAVEFELWRKKGTAGDDGEKVVEAKAVDATTLKVNFGKQLKTDINGVVYEYYVLEPVTPENYTKVEEGLKVTNTYVIPTAGEATATKVWEYPEGVDKPEPYPTVWFKLYRQVAGGAVEEVPGAEIKELPNSTLTVEWTGLEETDINGKVYTFSVKEVNATGADFKPNGYVKTEEGLKVMNTYDGLGGEDPVTVTATKVWAGIPDGGPYPKTTITLYQDGTEHGEAIELTCTGNGNQEAKWDKLLKYAPDSSEYDYTVDETGIPNGYKKTVSDDGLTFTNTYDGVTNNEDPEDPQEQPVTVTATKVWAGIPADTKDFPKATITLYQDGTEHGEAIELTSTGNGNQEAKWEKLLKYAPDSSEFTYTVKETDVPKGYKMEQKGFDITNTFITPYIPEEDITITVLLGSGLGNGLGECID